MIFAGIALHEEVGQQEEVVAPFAQRRQTQFDGIDTIEEVLAELASVDGGIQVGVGGAD